MIPDEVLESDIAAIAQKGAGKTYLMKGLVERNLHRDRRTLVIDPLGVWWGLKQRADGSPGFPVPVVGGRHADVPLDPSKGEELGAYIAASSGSLIIDVSDLRRGELIRFSTDLLRSLYRLNENALWLVMEEADVLAPQNPLGDATYLLHEVEQIARRGRNFGFRLWTITQRPARLHKDVLSMASALVLLRIRGPQDRKAVEDWVKGNAEKAALATVIDSLASLPVGDGWVYAPDVDMLERQHFPPIETLDNSATPKAGEVRGVVGELAKPDLGALLAAMTPAEDDGLLPTGNVKKDRTWDAGYERGEADQKRVQDAEVLKSYESGFAAGVAQGREEGAREAHSVIVGLLRPVIERLEGEAYGPEFLEVKAPDREKVVVLAQRAPVGAPAGSPNGNQMAPIAVQVAPPAESDPTPPGGALEGPLQKIIDAIAWWNTAGHPSPTPHQVAFMAGYSAKSSTWDTYRARARRAELIELVGDRMRLTSKGVGLARRPLLPPTLVAFHAMVRERLDGPVAKLFDVLVAAYPHSIQMGEWAVKAGYSASSSTSDTYRARAKRLALAVQPSPGWVKAAGWLFPEGMRRAG